jgi:murein tripeptide amidase MpaA
MPLSTSLSIFCFSGDCNVSWSMLLDGRDIDMVTIGTGPLKIWAIARQHPGESMAEWWMEGYLLRLMDTDDALIRKALQEATFYVVPNMNPG